MTASSEGSAAVELGSLCNSYRFDYEGHGVLRGWCWGRRVGRSWGAEVGPALHRHVLVVVVDAPGCDVELGDAVALSLLDVVIDRGAEWNSSASPASAGPKAAKIEASCGVSGLPPCWKTKSTARSLLPWAQSMGSTWDEAVPAR